MQITQHNLQIKFTYKQIVKTFIPIFCINFLQQLSYITNSYFLNNYNHYFLAIAGITGVYYLGFLVMQAGMGYSILSLISFHAGENNLNKIKNVFWNGFIWMIIFSIFAMLFTWLIAPIIFHKSLKSNTDAIWIIKFLRIRIIGFPFLGMIVILNNLLIGIHKSKWLWTTSICLTVINACLDYALINGRWHLPQMGFMGAAYSSIISELISFIILMVTLCIYMPSSIAKTLFTHVHIHTQQLKKIILHSSPIMIQIGLSVFIWEIFFIFVEHYGSNALANSNIAKIMLFIFGCFTWSLGSTGNSLLSNVIGQGFQSRLFFFLIKISKVMLAFSCVSVLILHFTNKYLINFIIGKEPDPSLLEILHVIYVTISIEGIAILLSYSLIAIEKTTTLLYIEIIACAIYIIGIIIVLPILKLPIPVGWMVEWVYWIMIGGLSYWYLAFKWNRRKTNDK